MERKGVTEPTARNLVRSSPTLIAALACAWAMPTP